ncbi:MAG: hypothetical protein RL199_2088 [Pseudomonadota bacterium]
MKVSLPRVDALNKGFADLFGRTFKTQKTPAPWVPAASDPIAMAFYGSQEVGSPPHVVWILDLPTSTGMAAALSMAPPAIANASVAARRMNELLVENFRETMNVAASLFDVSDGRLVLQRVMVPPTPTPPAVLMLAEKAKTRLDVSTYMQGYDSGRMSLLIVG